MHQTLKILFFFSFSCCFYDLIHKWLPGISPHKCPCHYCGCFHVVKSPETMDYIKIDFKMIELEAVTPALFKQKFSWSDDISYRKPRWEILFCLHNKDQITKPLLIYSGRIEVFDTKIKLSLKNKWLSLNLGTHPLERKSSSHQRAFSTQAKANKPQPHIFVKIGLGLIPYLTAGFIFMVWTQ